MGEVMVSTMSLPRRLGRSLIIVLLSLVLVLLSFIGAGVAFFAGALIIPSLIGLIVLALVVCFVLSGGFTWLYLRKRPAMKRRIAALGYGLGCTLLLVVLGLTQIFQPLATLDPSQHIPAGVRYWDLSTGSHIAYLKAAADGIANATPIIVVHGGPGLYAVTDQPMAAFYSQLAQLHYDVYLYDQVGSGLSSRLANPQQYTLARQIDDLAAIQQQIAAEKVILIGESWGGTLVANYMATHPANVARAVFMSPTPINYAEWKDFGSIATRLSPSEQLAIESYYLKPRLLTLSVLAAINPEIAKQFASDEELDAYLDHIFTSALGATSCNPAGLTGETIQGSGYYSSVFTLASAMTNKVDSRKLLTTNHTPSLILTGQCNYVKWDVTYQYKTTLPDSTLLYIPHAGHLIYFDQPELYFNCLKSFLLDQRLPIPPYTSSKPPVN